MSQEPITQERFEEIKSKARALVQTVSAIVEVIRENGAISGGLLYAGLLSRGVIDGIPSFNRLMEFVTAGGTVVKDGAHYRVATIAETEAFDKGLLEELGEGAVDLVKTMQLNAGRGN